MKRMKRFLRNTLAIMCLIIGVLGGFIPILQGWVFVLLAFILADFSWKYKAEQRIITFLDKFRFGRKLTALWARVKVKNADVMANGSGSVSDIYKNIKTEGLDDNN
ncbi:MAG: hypothetical protein II707_03250 [Spirochaetales bacterium]|nr:hypothetical protein [Spirochaetales bacterium]